MGYTELLPFFREAELKHGRIAMLAWTGLVVPDFVRIPGEAYSFEAVPVPIDAHDAFNAGVGPNFQILIFISVVEFCCAKKVFEWNSLETAGDYGLTGIFPKDAGIELFDNGKFAQGLVGAEGAWGRYEFDPA